MSNYVIFKSVRFYIYLFLKYLFKDVNINYDIGENWIYIVSIIYDAFISLDVMEFKILLDEKRRGSNWTTKIVWV